MSPDEAAKHCKAIAAQLAPLGDKITLKEAVVLRVYASLLFDPQPGLLNSFMDRTEGKVADKIEVSDLRDKPDSDLIREFQSIVDATAKTAGGSDPS